MDLLILSTFLRDGSITTDCRIEFSFDNGPFNEQAYQISSVPVYLPETPRPLTVKIRITPNNAQFWQIEGMFVYFGNGQLLPLGADRSDFVPAGSLVNSNNSVISLFAFVSRLKNVTQRVFEEVSNVPAIRPNVRQPWPPLNWGALPVVDHNFIASPPVSGPDLSFDTLSLTPQTEDLVFELKGVEAPQLIAVSWPKSLERTASSSSTPFLLYFHTNITQNSPEYYAPFTYPYGWDYLYFGFYRYLMYRGDPLTFDPYCKGLIYQVAASGKNVVLVLPLNRLNKEIGSFMDASVVHDVLKEIDAMMYRRVGIYFPRPEIGRCALGSFSAGTGLIAQFLGDNKNRKTSFYKDFLQEVYYYDPPGYITSMCVNQAVQWASAGSSSNKMVRLYTQTGAQELWSLLKVQLPPAPFILDTPNGRNTVALLGPGIWQRATSARGSSVANSTNPQNNFQDTHQLLSAMLLTDALRRSGF
jgi:hypothetical protein